MKHPLWLVNATLLVIFLAALGFVFFSGEKLPKRISLQPESSHPQTTKPSLAINIEQIYENDLFNTYHKTFTAPVQPSYAQPMPQPPTPMTVHVEEEPKQPFLPPLDITLKGIMSVDDNSNNQAIIADNKSNTEKNYRAGDTIEDAQLIRIFYNRIVLIRSNGQQETLYINEKDVETDPAYLETQENWSHIAKKIGENHYLLDPESLAELTQNLAQFIDILDLTTVYKEGRSIGCRVGKIPHNSLGAAMGLEPFDIITKINGMPVTSTDERYAAYKDLITKDFGDEINILTLRNETETKITYSLHDLKDPLDSSLAEVKKLEALPGIHSGPTEEDLEEEKINLLREKYKFAPTRQDIKVREKISMLKGKQSQAQG